MALQRPTRLVMGPCIVEIYHIVIREVQYQLEVNRCRNEEIIVKGNFFWVWPMWAGRPRIDRIVIREVQYQFEVNRLNGNFGWVWSMWTGRPRVEVQYQCEVNRCRNEEIIVKGNFCWCGLCGRGARGLLMGPCIVEIDRIVIREVQYKLEVNRLKGNFGWAWSMWADAPGLVMEQCIVEIGRIVIRDVQYQFEVNRCRNEEVNFQGYNSGQDGRKTEITTISQLFLRKAWG
ncbi:hypothetical protein DPMN_087127 [Dreissena polymorpha]|uniref:Uncharacterized protein n=1 Tax=Dreissena polymorpha TaxID=45954 RepID=A0A9D4QWL4_DREPO|nr:hypothetical protein DPMN_087127 [Dreissena polymorpha]